MDILELSTKLVLLATTKDEKEKERLTAEILACDHSEPSAFLKFTEKEIQKMPKNFRKEFRTNGLRAHIRKRVRGNCVNYEIRCRDGGLCISASGKTVEEAKARFIEKLGEADRGVDNSTPTKFDEFSKYYFEHFRKRKTTPETFKRDMCRYNKYLLPYFGNTPLVKITPFQCQELLDELEENGKGKTGDEIYSLMNVIFKCAIAHGLLTRNPLAIVFHQRHNCEHGKALTKEEEVKLLSVEDEKLKFSFAIALYTGLRPNEYPSLHRKGNMLIAINSKRKNGKIEHKRIPINPMLAPYIGDKTDLSMYAHKTLFVKIRKILPEHKLYDLRTTFYTRCRECGVPDAARDEMMGHSSGVLADTYTDLSDEYLFRAVGKFQYDLTPNLTPN